jgi:hypothetical protein
MTMGQRVGYPTLKGNALSTLTNDVFHGKKDLRKLLRQ